METITCVDCGVVPVPSGITTGSATLPNGDHVCFACCGIRDRKTMIETGHSKQLPLYLSNGMASNWPGTLKFPVYGLKTIRTAGFSGSAKRTIGWFNGPDGFVWYGFQQGDWNQIFHARRTKAKAAGRS